MVSIDETTEPRRPVSKTLQNLRYARGMDLESLSQVTRIRVDYLEAIEAGEIRRLPEGLYRRSFVRAYLHALGMTDERVVEQAMDELAGSLDSLRPTSLQPGLATQAPRVRRSTPWVAVLGVAAAVLGIGVLFWGDRRVAETPRVPEAATRAVVPEQTQESARPAGLVFAGAQAQSGTAVARAERGSALPVTASAAGMAERQEVASAPDPTPQVRAATGATALLRANEPVWLRIRPQGEPSRELTLNEGSSLELELNGPVELLIGNAGGLEVLVNGKRLPALGKAGQVRSLVLDPRNLPSPEGT
jgi:cytoskeleton protein RodZ